MVPGRIGSQRFKKKNFADLRGKPLMSYAINSAINSNIFDDIYVNSDDISFKQIADDSGVKFHHRPIELGSSSTKSDDVVYEFINKVDSDIIVWVNPICPLMTGLVLRKCIEQFIENDYDSAVTGRNFSTHAACRDIPINYSVSEKFAKTQDLQPIFVFSYSAMIWKSKEFKNHFEENKFAFLFKNIGHIEVDFFSSLTVKYKEDLDIIDSLFNKVYLKNNDFKQI